MIIKTDWKGSDALTANDVNRIEGNIETNSTIADWPTATGTTTIEVAAPHFELKAGKSLTFIAGGNNNSNPTTININGLGAKNLYKANTSEAPLIKTGRAYSVWYSGTDFFVKASAEGDAVAGDVLADKIFSNDDDIGVVGTMTNNGTVSTDISAKATEVTIAQGYHSGSGKVKISATEQAKIITGNIKAGITLLGVAGKSSVVDTADADAVAGDILNGKIGYVNGSKITGNIPSKGAATYTPGTASQTISAGQYLSGAQTISGDADLVAGNIKSGVNIFGVTGSFSGGIKTIQFGDSAQSGSQANITLGTEIESDNAFVIIKNTITNYNPGLVTGKYLVGLTDTTLSLSPGEGCQYIVIEFQPGVIKSIIRGTDTPTSSTKTINHSAVVIAKSFILLDSNYIGYGSQVSPTSCALAYITSRTTTSFTYYSNNYYDTANKYGTASYQIVEFN
jgi:hypothetical protein